MEYLFKDMDQLQEFYPFGKLEFVTLLPDLELVTEKYLHNDIFDDSTFQKLLSEANLATQTDEFWGNLVRLSRNPTAKLLALYHLPEANVDYTGVGLLVARTEKAVPASDNRAKDLKLALMHKTQDMLGLLVQYLQNNTAVFVDWAQSDKRKSTLIRDAWEFSQSYPIDDNSWVFRKLQPLISEVEATYLKELLGAEYLEELKTEVDQSSLSEDNEKVMKLLRPAICNYTMEIAFPRLAIDISPRGIILFSNQRSNYDEAFEAASDNVIMLQINKAKSTADNFASKVSDYLNENASDSKYEAYFNGKAYQDPDVDINDFGNDPDDEERNGFWTG